MQRRNICTAVLAATAVLALGGCANLDGTGDRAMDVGETGEIEDGDGETAVTVTGVEFEKRVLADDGLRVDFTITNESDESDDVFGAASDFSAITTRGREVESDLAFGPEDCDALDDITLLPSESRSGCAFFGDVESFREIQEIRYHPIGSDTTLRWVLS